MADTLRQDEPKPARRRAGQRPTLSGAARTVAVETTDAERAVADLLPIEAPPERAREVLRRVPFWFHTFALNRAHGLYTPGVARDHRYRIKALPADCSGLRVLDVGAFDGFYSFLAERRGAARVVAVDNEQYKAWVRSRWGVELHGGEGFRAIAELLESRVEYHRLDAFEVEQLGERFDLVFCFGILHRVESPLGLLRVLRRCVADGGRVLLETYGIEGGGGRAEIRVSAPGEVYAGDDFVYWEFGADGLARLARLAGFRNVEIVDTPMVDGHPRILGHACA